MKNKEPKDEKKRQVNESTLGEEEKEPLDKGEDPESARALLPQQTNIGFGGETPSHTVSGFEKKKHNRSRREPSLFSMFDTHNDVSSGEHLAEKIPKSTLQDYLINSKSTTQMDASEER